MYSEFEKLLTTFYEKFQFLFFCESISSLFMNNAEKATLLEQILLNMVITYDSKE